jgi:hypothetical protein
MFANASDGVIHPSPRDSLFRFLKLGNISVPSSAPSAHYKQ